MSFYYLLFLSSQSEGANRSVFDQLEDYRIGTASTEHSNVGF